MIIEASKNMKALELWKELESHLYDLEPKQLLIGYPAEGHVSGYYSSSKWNGVPGGVDADYSLNILS